MVRANARSNMLIIAALLAATAVVYARVPWFDFVNYDDYDYVKANPWVSRGLTWDGVKWAFTTNAQANWHPLTYLSLMADVTLGKGRPWILHLTNIILHLCNTALLFLFLSAYTRRKWPSAFAAAMFALHPLHVESVAWISERKDVLSTLFWLLTLLAYARYTRGRNVSAYVLVAVTFSLGLMAKPTLVTLPIVLLLMDFWPLSRSSQRGGSDERTTIRHLLFEKIPLFVMSGVAATLTLWAQKAGGALCRFEYFSAGIRISNALVSYVAYIGKTIWPVNLAVFYPHPRDTLPEWQVVASAVLLVVITALAVRFRNRHPYAYVGWLWYLVTLLPVVGIVQVGEQGMADRYTYVPLIGLSIAAAWLSPRVFRRLVPQRAAVPLVVASALAAIAACTFATYKQTGYWRNGATLFRHTLTCTADNTVALNGLGCALLVDGKRKEAIECFRRALRLSPGFANASVNLAKCCVESGDTREAEKLFRKVVRAFPRDDDALYGLGHVLFRSGRIREAKELFQQAVQVNSNNVAAFIGLGSISILERDMEQARLLYGEALRIEPSSAEAHFGVALASDGLGRYKDAAFHYRASLGRRYRVFESSNNLAWILATSSDADLRNPSEAIRLARIAVRHSGKRKSAALDTLAAAYASANRYSEAVECASEAVRLYRVSRDADGVSRAYQRLLLYKSGKPYIKQ